MSLHQKEENILFHICPHSWYTMYIIHLPALLGAFCQRNRLANFFMKKPGGLQQRLSLFSILAYWSHHTRPGCNCQVQSNTSSIALQQSFYFSQVQLWGGGHPVAAPPFIGWSREAAWAGGNKGKSFGYAANNQSSANWNRGTKWSKEASKVEAVHAPAASRNPWRVGCKWRQQIQASTAFGKTELY